MYQQLAIIALFVLIYSALAGGVERTWVSAPIAATFVGLILGPVGLGFLTMESDAGTIRILAELTLALVLFTDAAGSNLKVLRHSAGLPIRLILISLPLTIALGWVVAYYMAPGLGVFEVALLATMLAPTDAALGKYVITNRTVPARVREALNIESGLNDGICVPILFVFLLLALENSAGESAWQFAAIAIAEEIGIGLLVGVGLSALAVRLLGYCDRRGWLVETWLQFPVVALALACFAAAQALGGSGFIAAFAAGMLFGARQHEHRKTLLRAAEGSGDTMSVITWVVFGAVVVGTAVPQFTWRMLLYAVFSLTLIRMLPTYLALGGLGLSAETKLFIGWFGPRGLASIVFAVIVIDSGIPSSDLLALAVSCTILLSVLAHGFSAHPWVQRYGRRVSAEHERGGN